jgi:hypothetical protein
MWSWERSALQTRSRKPRISEYIVAHPWEQGAIWQVSKTILAWDACRNCCRELSCSHRDPQCHTSALGSPHKAVMSPSTYHASFANIKYFFVYPDVSFYISRTWTISKLTKISISLPIYKKNQGHSVIKYHRWHHQDEFTAVKSSRSV